MNDKPQIDGIEAARLLYAPLSAGKSATEKKKPKQAEKPKPKQ